MNLIEDIWLPIVRKDGKREKIAICQLLDDYSFNPVMKLEAPRPDLRNALYQLLIGIVQVVATPEDEEEWMDLYKDPYDSKSFLELILTYKECFEIDTNGPAFMQDYRLENPNPMSLAKLFLDSPSDNALKLNKDHFIKRDTIRAIDPYWAAVALYALQTFTAGMGAGHRVGLRGGGPLTTIICLDPSCTLWQNIWINILSAGDIQSLPGDIAKVQKENFFPWMRETKTSVNGEGLFAQECHPFHHYFGMPLRIRLLFEQGEGVCDVTGNKSICLVTGIESIPHGNNYSGVWLHPLTAYRNPMNTKQSEPIPIKAQPTGVDYRYWGGLITSTDEETSSKNILVLRSSDYRREALKETKSIVWAAGFDTDKGKTRNWYESTMPLYPLDIQTTKKVSEFVKGLIDNSSELCKELLFAIKSAWFNSPKKAKGDMSFIETSFWKDTESSFYDLIDTLVNNIDDNSVKNRLIDHWGLLLQREASRLFEENVLAQQEDGLNMRRIVSARRKLDTSIRKIEKRLNKQKEVEA